MTVRLQTDLFPCEVLINYTQTGDTRQLTRARVIVTGDAPDSPARVYVYLDSGDGPKCVYSAPATTYTPARRASRLRELYTPETRTHTIQTPTTLIAATREGGCGCGSRLKSFNPFPSMAALAAS